jgi:ribosome-associated heat shock protein Hsp15
VKHRSDAQALVEQGGVRVNKAKVSRGSHAVKPEDILTIAVHGCVHVVKVLGEAERRGPPVAARLLYVEIAANPHEGAAQKQDASPPPVC